MDDLALSVILVNYCRWGSTHRLVRSLRASQSIRNLSAEIVIVDNHSPTHPALKRLRRTEGVSLRRWRRNFGFARAVNEGARLSRGQWLFLLNPDVSISDTFLDDARALTSTLDASVGVVGLGIRNEDGSFQPSTGPIPTLASTLSRLVLPRAWRKYHLIKQAQQGATPWTSGCALLIRRACFEELGGLDPRFFLYYEDVDFCLRARQADWDVLYEPSLSVCHHHPLASRNVTPWLRVVTRHALMTFAEKHWSRWQCGLLNRVIRTEMWLRQHKANHKQDHSAADIFERRSITRKMGESNIEEADRILRNLVKQDALGDISEQKSRDGLGFVLALRCHARYKWKHLIPWTKDDG